MGDQLSHILNVTIAYPGQEDKSFWAFLCGEVTEIVVRVETIPITDDLRGDYPGDSVFRERFQQWLNALWEDKDAQLKALEGLAPEVAHLSLGPQG